MNKETEKLLITVLKKLNTALDIYMSNNKKSNYRLMVVQVCHLGDDSMVIYKTKSKRFKDIFYYDTEIANAIGIEYSSDYCKMSEKVLDYLNNSEDFEHINMERACNYLQKELWRIAPTELFELDEGSTGDVFDFRLCVEKYIIPKYKKYLN